MFLSYNEWPLIFGNASLQKYFNIQIHKKKTLIYTFKTLWYNQNQCNTLNKQRSLDLDVAYRVYVV